MIIVALKLLLGILCLVIGFVARITPLTPGAWLIFVGMELLGLTFLLPRRIWEPWERLKARLLLRLRHLTTQRS
jgi:uncharacterized protein YqgC (DUF456 family)